MWTPLQMEMLGELKADPERRLADAGRVRNVRATRRPRLRAISAATAGTLRRAADRLDPAPRDRRARRAGLPGRLTGSESVGDGRKGSPWPWQRESHQFPGG